MCAAYPVQYTSAQSLLKNNENGEFNFILKYILEISLDIIPKLWYNTYTI